MGKAMGFVGAGLGITQSIMGAIQANDARKALENYERQELENVAENLTVSTLGADLQREENARLASTQIDALRGGGSRAIIGGSGRVEEGLQRANLEIAADLDRQQKDIDRMYAQDEANIRGMVEARENADIAGLSSQYTAGRQALFDGMGNALRGASMAATSGSGATESTDRPMATTVNEMKPAGVVSNPTFASPARQSSFGMGRYGGSGMGMMNNDYGFNF
jgi:hypothetical protein